MKIFKILCGFLIILSAATLIYSCNDEILSTSDINNLVELRSIKCDGAPMPPPKVLHSYTTDSTCCFTLQFSPVFLAGTACQIIGFDSNGGTLASAPNGFCVQPLGSNNELSCCITNEASSITISLNTHDINIATCVEIPLPCK